MEHKLCDSGQLISVISKTKTTTTSTAAHPRSSYSSGYKQLKSMVQVYFILFIFICFRFMLNLSICRAGLANCHISSQQLVI